MTSLKSSLRKLIPKKYRSKLGGGRKRAKTSKRTRREKLKKSKRRHRRTKRKGG